MISHQRAAWLDCTEVKTYHDTEVAHLPALAMSFHFRHQAHPVPLLLMAKCVIGLACLKDFSFVRRTEGSGVVSHLGSFFFQDTTIVHVLPLFCLESQRRMLISIGPRCGWLRGCFIHVLVPTESRRTNIEVWSFESLTWAYLWAHGMFFSFLD